MKIVKQAVELIWITHNAQQQIEKAGRTCYKSEDKITADSAHDFAKKMRVSGHHAMIEHASASFRIITDRGISHEIVRHRIASFCLSGDTELVAYRSQNKIGRSQKKWTLKQLYDWQSDPKRKGRIQLIRIRSVDIEGIIVPGIIKKIFDSGVQDVFKVTTRSGKTIKSTLKHRFLSDSGWKRLGNLRVGDRIFTNGCPVLENKDWIIEQYIKKNKTRKEVAKLAGCCEATLYKKFKEYGIFKPWKDRPNRMPGRGIKGMFSAEAIKNIKKRMSGIKNHTWLGENITNGSGRSRANRIFKKTKPCWGCNKKNRIERHHVDSNPKNNDRSNILFLCEKCHKSFHLGQGVLTILKDEIVSIEKIGEEQTFDIEMKNRPHNFIADGFVVHNSQESTRYCNYSAEKFGKEITVIQPPDLTPFQKAMWQKSCEDSEDSYFRMLEMGCSPQIARSVLPTCLKTELVMTANFREFRHFITLRKAKAAHPQIRPIADAVLNIMMQHAPGIFEDL